MKRYYFVCDWYDATSKIAGERYFRDLYAYLTTGEGGQR